MPGHEALKLNTFWLSFWKHYVETVTFTRKNNSGLQIRPRGRNRLRKPPNIVIFLWSLTLRAHLGLYLRGSSQHACKRGLGGICGDGGTELPPRHPHLLAFPTTKYDLRTNSPPPANQQRAVTILTDGSSQWQTWGERESERERERESEREREREREIERERERERERGRVPVTAETLCSVVLALFSLMYLFNLYNFYSVMNSDSFYKNKTTE